MFGPARGAWLSGLVRSLVLWKDRFGSLALRLLLLVAIAVVRRCSLLLLLLAVSPLPFVYSEDVLCLLFAPKMSIQLDGLELMAVVGS